MDKFKAFATIIVALLILALIGVVTWIAWPYLVWARYNLGNILVTFIATAIIWFLIAVLFRFLRRG